MTETHIFEDRHGNRFAVQTPMDEETRDLLISPDDVLVEIVIVED